MPNQQPREVRSCNAYMFGEHLTFYWLLAANLFNWVGMCLDKRHNLHSQDSGFEGITGVVAAFDPSTACLAMSDRITLVAFHGSVHGFNFSFNLNWTPINKSLVLFWDQMHESRHWIIVAFNTCGELSKDWFNQLNVKWPMNEDFAWPLILQRRDTQERLISLPSLTRRKRL